MSAPSLTAFAQGQGAVSADTLNGIEQTCDTFAELRGLVGLPGMQVYARGQEAPADGLGGPFYWNSTSTAPDDNQTILKPTGGAYMGRWVILPAQGSAGPDQGQGVNFPNVAAMEAGTVSSSKNTVVLNGYLVAGDIPPALMRRAQPSELALPGTISTLDGSVWVFDESELIPEWFGALGNANGMTGVGNDDAPAIRNMIGQAEGIGAVWSTRPGHSYRLASYVNSPANQICLLLVGTGSRGLIQGNLVHDCYTDNLGSPAAIFTRGTTGSHISNVQIRFDGGMIVFPTNAVQPGTSTKQCIIMFCVDNFYLARASTSALTYTGFQIKVSNSNNGVVDGGFAGIPLAPTNNGDDGLHIIGACSNIVAYGGLSNSGDDSISLTQESGSVGLTMNNIVISDWVCSTYQAKTIKVYIDNTTSNCVIRDVTISNIFGTVRGSVTGAGIVVDCQVPTSPLVEGLIENIKIVNVNLNAGTVPKSSPNSGTDGGNFVYVRNATNVEIIDSTLTGSSNSMILFRDSTGGGVRGGTIYPSGPMPAIPALVNVPIVSAIANSNGTIRFTFSGSPDLSSVVSQLAANAAYANEYDNKYNILTTMGMATTGQTGNFRIVAANNGSSYVDVENVRPGVSNEPSPTGATGTITLSKTPDIQIIDCQDITINDTVVNGPLGWAACWLGYKGGTINNNNEVRLTIRNVTYGHGMYVKNGQFGRYSVVGRRVASGSYMIYIPVGGGVSEAYNHILASDDFSGIADSTKGWGRAFTTFYDTDFCEAIRGVTTNRVTGTVTQSSSSATFTISANSAIYAAGPYTDISPLDLRLVSQSGTLAYSVAWNSTTAVFTVTTAVAAISNTVWNYLISPPA